MGITSQGKWTHDGLANDLAEHLRRASDRMVWEDMQLGPSGSPRPDVYTIPKVYSRFCPIAYEIKISVADFRSDVTSGKWQSYLKFAAGVIFAVPDGLVSKNEVPPTCGLMVRKDKVWRSVKGPTLTPVASLPKDTWMKLLLDGIWRVQEKIGPRKRSVWDLERANRRALSADVLKVLRDLQGARGALAAAREEAQKILADAKADARAIRELDREDIVALQRKIAATLDLDLNTDIGRLAQFWEEYVDIQIENLSSDREVQRLRGIIDSLGRIVEGAYSPPRNGGGYSWEWTQRRVKRLEQIKEQHAAQDRADAEGLFAEADD